jgi:hypothetical protein
MATADERLDVRTLIPDTDAIYGAAQNENLFTDDEIDRFFRLGGDNAMRAAGLAMIAVGNSEAMISKVIVTQDLETDGAKAQKEWREAGKLLIARADDVDGTVLMQIVNYREGWAVYPPELTEAPWDGNWPYGYGV